MTREQRTQYEAQQRIIADLQAIENPNSVHHEIFDIAANKIMALEFEEWENEN